MCGVGLRDVWVMCVKNLRVGIRLFIKNRKKVATGEKVLISERNHIILMRGRSNDYCFIEPMIVDILDKSPAPVQALCVSFKLNEMSGKIINLKVVKNHLNDLVAKKKVVKEIKKDDSIFYSLRK